MGDTTVAMGEDTVATTQDTTAITWRTIPATTMLAENLDPPCGGHRTRATPPAAAPGRVTASPASRAAGVAVAREARAEVVATTMMTPQAPAMTTTTGGTGDNFRTIYSLPRMI